MCARVVCEVRIVGEGEEARVFCDLGRVEFEAAHDALVRADRTLIEAAYTHLSACTELLGGDDALVRVLPIETHGTDPVALRARLIVRARTQQGELTVCARRDALVVRRIPIDVRREANVVGERAVCLSLAMMIGQRGECNVVVALIVHGRPDEGKTVVALRMAVSNAEIKDVLVARRIGEEPLIVQVDIRRLAADIDVKEVRPDGIVVDVRAPMADAQRDGPLPLGHETPIGECADLYVAKMSR